MGGVGARAGRKVFVPEGFGACGLHPSVLEMVFVPRLAASALALVLLAACVDPALPPGVAEGAPWGDKADGAEPAQGRRQRSLSRVRRIGQRRVGLSCFVV